MEVPKFVKIDKLNRYHNTFELPDPNFVQNSPMSPEEIDKSAELDELEKDLLSSFRILQFDEIEKIKDDFINVGIDSVKKEYVERFISRLPQFERHLEIYQNIFETFSFITNSKKLAKVVYENIKNIQFEGYSTFPVGVKNQISVTIYHIVRAIPDSVSNFRITFFPYFLEYLKSSTLYQSEELSIHLELASQFIPVIDDDSINEMFSIFSIFINHTSPSIIYSSLYSLIKVIIKSPESLTYFNDYDCESFFNRLYYLGIQNNESTQLVLILLEYILKNNQIQYPNCCYETINNLIIYLLTQEHVDSRFEAISLISFVFANSFYMNSTADIHKLIETFLIGYPKFKLKEKREAINCFANFMGYVNIEIVDHYFQEDIFFMPFQDLFEFDDPQYMLPFLDGLYNCIVNSRTICKLHNQCEFIMQKCQEFLEQSNNKEIVDIARIILTNLEKLTKNN